MAAGRHTLASAMLATALLAAPCANWAVGAGQGGAEPTAWFLAAGATLVGLLPGRRLTEVGR
jgi:hypothetical protein